MTGERCPERVSREAALVSGLSAAALIGRMGRRGVGQSAGDHAKLSTGQEARLVRNGLPAGSAADLSRQRLFPERAVRLFDVWAGLLAPGSNQTLHLPTAGLFMPIVFRPTLELHAVAIAKFVPGYSGGTATDSHRLPYSSPRQQAVRDTQVCVRSRHARDGFEQHHRNARRKDFNHVPERFRESTAASQFTQFRVFSASRVACHSNAAPR